MLLWFKQQSSIADSAEISHKNCNIMYRLDLNLYSKQ